MKDDEISIDFTIPEEIPTPEKCYRQGGSELDKFVAQIRLDNRKSSRICLDDPHFAEVYEAKETDWFTVTSQCEPKDSIINLCHEIERVCPQGIEAWDGMVVQFCVAADELSPGDLDPLSEWMRTHHLSSDDFAWGLYRSDKQPMARVIVYKRDPTST